MEIKLDLHVHSHLSPDGRMSPEEIAAAAKKAGLQAVAICDHERVWQGARECDGILLIPGGEFSTEHGHLLGLFLSSPIEKGSFAETAAAIRAQGGIPVLAHPFQKRRAAESLAPLAPALTGAEVFNSRADRKNPRANEEAAAFAESFGLLPFAGSDAHVAQEVGNAFIRLEVSALTEEEIKAALLQGKGRFTGKSSPHIHVARSQWTKLRKTGAKSAAYAKWLLFAAKCALEDLKNRKD